MLNCKQQAAHHLKRPSSSALRRLPQRVFRASLASVRSGSNNAEFDELEHERGTNDFILSILHSNPSIRDTKSYLASFGPRKKAHPSPPNGAPQFAAAPQREDNVPVTTTTIASNIPTVDVDATTTHTTSIVHPQTDVAPSPLISAILEPVYRRTALVKIQGPFTDRQLESVATGMVYLEKLGLVSVVVVDHDDWQMGESGERSKVSEEAMRVTAALERQGARARPLLEPIVKLGPAPGDNDDIDAAQLRGDGSGSAYNDGDAYAYGAPDVQLPEAHVHARDLMPIRSALRAGEIPVLTPIAIDSFLRSVRIDANDVIAALVRGMVGFESRDRTAIPTSTSANANTNASNNKNLTDTALSDVDLTPLRLMIINREGGIPSYARSGYPHLLVNLNSEFGYIHSTFNEPWQGSHPTALRNLSLARTCLAYMPPTSSAVVVSHRSPKSLIANLITNKPIVSSSLPHALLQGNRKLTPHTPTLIRRGLPITVINSVRDLDRPKMKRLLEESFGRTLDEEAYYKRLETHLDFVIVAGDYIGAAIVTKEFEELPKEDTSLRDRNENEDKDKDAQMAPPATPPPPISYLDKFAVLPAHQGDGTVDFLWVALHDETYGLGIPASVNPNGGKQGQGVGHDLVWRSRGDNPVNKWYFERSTGHLRLGGWVLFWCDAERRLKNEAERRAAAVAGTGRRREGASFVEPVERGRLERWAEVVQKIGSSWKLS